MKNSSKFGLLVYGICVFVLLPLLLVSINARLHLPIYKTQLVKIIGIALIIFGGVLGAYSASIFAENGKGGSPLPTDPPRQLITSGVFSWIRNPMFVASALVWFGEYLFFGSTLLFFYAIAWVSANHIHLITQDEKWLEKRFGDEYRKYKKKVPRYFPKLITFR
jgi:protein-S-isoprenylcysteine O-methyltransferase Ste14